MFSTLSVAVTPDTLAELMDHLRSSGAPADPAAAVETAIHYWLTAMKESAQDGARVAPRGYQWKSLFLPEGTWLRMAYRNDHEYAIVEGDHIMYRGRRVSPNQFATANAGSVRNAWHDISLRLPAEKNWKIAYQRRRELLRAEQQAQVATTTTSVPAPALAQAAPLSNAPNTGPGIAHDERAAAAAAVPLAQYATTRIPPAGPNWTEPERRKFRLRIEDVAFE